MIIYSKFLRQKHFHSAPYTSLNYIALSYVAYVLIIIKTESKLIYYLLFKRSTGHTSCPSIKYGLISYHVLHISHWITKILKIYYRTMHSLQQMYHLVFMNFLLYLLAAHHQATQSIYQSIHVYILVMYPWVSLRLFFPEVILFLITRSTVIFPLSAF